MFITELLRDPISLLFWIAALLLGITVHEFMHAWTANYLGDPTAKAAGRVTLNPIAHLDPIGTIMLLLFRFGWGKPVPVNPIHFKNPKVGEALTSLAGPFANLVTLIIFAIIYRFLPQKESLFAVFIVYIIIINTVLMIFNLIPIPPLDGSKLLYSILPANFPLEKYEVYGPFLLIPLIFIIGPYVLTPILSFILQFLGISI